MRIRGWAILFCTLLLSACVTTGELEVKALQARCDFSGDPRFAVLRGKVPLSPAQAAALPTVAELTNNNTPTPAERQALLVADAAVRPCREGLIDIATRTRPPRVVAIYRQLGARVVGLQAQLAAGQLTYGQYRRLSYEAATSADRVVAGNEESGSGTSAGSNHMERKASGPTYGAIVDLEGNGEVTPYVFDPDTNTVFKF